MDIRLKRIRELEKWFSTEYIVRLETIKRHKFFGFKPSENEYDLQLEAYDKEQEIRSLKGLEPLPEIKSFFKI